MVWYVVVGCPTMFGSTVRNGMVEHVRYVLFDQVWYGTVWCGMVHGRNCTCRQFVRGERILFRLSKRSRKGYSGTGGPFFSRYIN